MPCSCISLIARDLDTQLQRRRATNCRSPWPSVALCRVRSPARSCFNGRGGVRDPAAGSPAASDETEALCLQCLYVHRSCPLRGLRGLSVDSTWECRCSHANVRRTHRDVWESRNRPSLISRPQCFHVSGPNLALSSSRLQLWDGHRRQKNARSVASRIQPLSNVIQVTYVGVLAAQLQIALHS